MAHDLSAILDFVASAVRWCRDGSAADLERLIRSHCSGVPHDVGAAYATVAARTGSLLDAIDASRLALPASDRDAVLRFAERTRRLATLAPELEDEPLRTAISEAFELRPSADFVETNASRASSKDGSQVDVAQPLDREADGPVYARQKHFSASALNAYAECERKWFYRYACGAVEDRASPASVYGTAFHGALEDFHAEFPRPSKRDEQAMRERIALHVTWAFERYRDGFETPVGFLLQLRRAQRTAARYVDWLVSEAARAPFTVIGREVPANLALGEQTFVGFIDRLDRDDRTGGVAVVDYKTGSIATSADEYRDMIRAFEDFQLPFYYWARTAEGDKVVRLALLPLRDARLDIRPVVLEVDAGVLGDLERARSRMIEMSTDLASGRARRFAVTRDPDACTFCAYAVACANKPIAPSDRFGR